MSRRKGAQISTRKNQQNGLYIHSSPPRVVNASSARVKQLVRAGDLDKLESFVIQGQGAKLLGEFSSDFKIRKFIRNQVPAIMSKISQLHDAVASGSLEDLKAVLQDDCGRRKKLVLCKDQAGVGLLHKAVYYDLPEIYKFLIENYPQTATVRDAEGRTAAHYVAMCRDSAGVQRLLAATGADLHATDKHGHTYKYYMDNPTELELPTSNKPSMANGSDKSASASSRASKDNLVIKPSNIRIWIHQRDLGKLQRVLWEGQGMKLKTEHCNNPKIKKFLEAVPHLMGVIKDIHSAAINGDLEMVRQRTEPPVLPIILSSKDQNSLTALHKAAGLGHTEVARFIAFKYPAVVNTTDSDGRTPLHYAALLKDGDDMYNMLIDAGAEESALDNKQKAAAYYRTRPNEIDTKLLSVIPEAPRTSTATFPPNWDWNLLIPTESSAEEPKKSKKKSDTLFGITPTEEQKPIEKLIEELPSKNSIEKEEPPSPLAEIEPEPLQVEEVPPLEEEVDKNDVEEDQDDVISPDDDVITEVPTEQTNGHSNADVLQIESEEEAVEEPKAEDLPVEEDPEPASIPKEIPGPDPIAEVDSQEIGVIEGVVNGEDEVETLNNDENNSTGDEHRNGEAAGEDDIPTNIAEMVEAGNMEQLAAIVLNGEGEKLVGQTSENQEIQAFLDNVPIYMSKINRIHVAAREGSLRDLQAALDRRKFAIAKDPKVSPNGATPLHVATVFGNTNIVRYLAGRFPETVQQVDNNGRTPLHYAATLADNGHYYNLLIHLGASSSAKDNFDKDAEFYMSNPEELSHKMLLRELGATGTEAEDMLADKENPEAAPANTADIPLFRTEEGRYLATSLGDPLIKGLTEVANNRPEDPIAYLATYLYNFANNNNNPKRIKTQESRQNQEEIGQVPVGANIGKNNNPVDVVVVDPKDSEDSIPNDTAFSSATRDEHGQSMLHFAAARQHGRNTLFQLLQETDINLGYRDELYRTARDVSIQAGMPDNTKQIDRYIVFLAANGDTDKLVELLLEGYDHIIDIVDEEEVPILQVVEKQGDALQDTIAFLHSVLTFEERRERVHHAIRQGSLEQVQEMLADEKDTGSGKLLAIGKNSYGRCTLHIAVLCQQEEVVDYLANTFPDTLQIGDNLERTALHYAMGVDKVESISKLLIDAGAKRVLKDLKGRQPSYYFMNKSDILRLQEEEETF